VLVLVPGAQPPWRTLEVRDDGPGVPEALRGRLFEPYATTRPPGEGMGLGLAIARKILLDQVLSRRRRI
jgi:C4-dicarboxylate-specific signal transduction histidine kinase